MDLSGHGKKASEQGALTNWRPERERHVKAQKKSDRARGTNFLETAGGGTRHDTERKRWVIGARHSRPGDRRGGDLSEHGKAATEPGALTL